MKGYKFVIPGKPYPSPRPRATTRGGFATVYMPKEYMKHKLWIQSLLPPLHLKGPILVSMEYYFEMPKSWSKKKKSKMLGYWHSQKPDTDNLDKTVLDAMSKLVYQDDGQRSTGRVLKEWATVGKTILTVIPLEEQFEEE